MENPGRHALHAKKLLERLRQIEGSFEDMTLAEIREGLKDAVYLAERINEIAQAEYQSSKN